VVLQNLGLVDASPVRHDGVPENRNQIAGKIVGMSPQYLAGMLKPPAQPEQVAKTMPPHYAPKVSEMRLGTPQTQCSQGLRHGAKRETELPLLFRTKKDL
jgi:hypothetical protein